MECFEKYQLHNLGLELLVTTRNGQEINESHPGFLRRFEVEVSALSAERDHKQSGSSWWLFASYQQSRLAVSPTPHHLRPTARSRKKEAVTVSAEDQN